MKENKNANTFFRSIERDSTYTTKCFLDAIADNSTDEAEAYISRNYIDKIDLMKVKDRFIDRNKNVPLFLIKAKISYIPKNCKVDTVLISDIDDKKSKFVHIYMLHEPDEFANWKIYNIEEESI